MVPWSLHCSSQDEEGMDTQNIKQPLLNEPHKPEYCPRTLLDPSKVEDTNSEGVQVCGWLGPDGKSTRVLASQAN